MFLTLCLPIPYSFPSTSFIIVFFMLSSCGKSSPQSGHTNKGALVRPLHNHIWWIVSAALVLNTLITIFIHFSSSHLTLWLSDQSCLYPLVLNVFCCCPTLPSMCSCLFLTFAFQSKQFDVNSFIIFTSMPASFLNLLQ